MKNRISCSAQELNQLDPDMLQSVVGGTIFEIGKQYFTDQRVRILDADKVQVKAEVNGPYGVYSQTVKLRAGTLLTRCSCPLTEQPFCRHCIAVLLHQVHNGSSLKPDVQAAHQDPAGSGPDTQVNPTDLKFEESNGAVDLNFWEAILFIDWVQKAFGVLGKKAALPPVPDSLCGVARDWVGAVSRVHAQFLESEEDRSVVQKNLQSAEDMIVVLKQKVDALKGEADRLNGSTEDQK
jgi:hypothetical protein